MQLSGAAVADMVYAEAVVREALRVRTIIGGVIRSAKRDFELDGHRVPAGTLVNVGFFEMIKRDSR